MSCLNSNYTFDRFVVGPSSHFAHDAALTVSQKPAKKHSPLFIYGDTGLGKTHLLNAIGLKMLYYQPDCIVIYTTVEMFVNEMIASIRHDRMPLFRQKYFKTTCLLFDDADYLVGRDRAQKEFFHILEMMNDSGKQIVITSGRYPENIENLGNRLRSHFQFGLIAQIKPPELETRVAIIKLKMKEHEVTISNEVIRYIASQVGFNIIELEGALIQLRTCCVLTGNEIDFDLFEKVLKGRSTFVNL